MTVARLVAAVGWGIGLVLAAETAAAQPARLTITYLANMGVQLQGGGKSVVIDGFHHGALAEYAALPPSMLAALEGARPPFDAIDLILTTHRHRDHFEPASVAARLRADPSAVFVAAVETVDSLRAGTPAGVPAARVRGIRPPRRSGQRLTVAGIDLTVLDLPHNPTPSRRVANVGFIVEIGGVRVLHVGDADPAVEGYEPHRLAQGAIDVAIVPFWYLTGSGRAVLGSIGARILVATHVPPSDTAAVRRRVMASDPNATVMTTPGQRLPIP